MIPSSGSCRAPCEGAQDDESERWAPAPKKRKRFRFLTQAGSRQVVLRRIYRVMNVLFQSPQPRRQSTGCAGAGAVEGDANTYTATLTRAHLHAHTYTATLTRPPLHAHAYTVHLHDPLARRATSV